MTNALVRSPVTLWVDGSTILQAELTTIDANLAASVNGVDGSCHSPLVPIIITGAGLTVTAPTIVARGGTLTTLSGARYQLEDGDWPTYGANHPGTSRTLITPGITAFSPNDPTTSLPQIATNVASMAAQFVRTCLPFSTFVVEAFIPLRVVDHSTLATATLRYLPGAPPWLTNFLTNPKARLLRVTAATGVAAPCSSTATGADANGFFSFDPKVAAAIAIPCDQNNAVDISASHFLLHVVEATGQIVQTGDCRGASVANVSTASIGLGTIDGVTFADQDRVLLKNQTNTLQNGIWLASAGPWTRAPDQIVPGMYTRIAAGTVNTNSQWIVTTAGTIFMGATPIAFTSFSQTAPFGNMLQSVSALFTSITDTRFQ